MPLAVMEKREPQDAEILANVLRISPDETEKLLYLVSFTQQMHQRNTQSAAYTAGEYYNYLKL